MIQAVVFDWGDTLMRVFDDPGPMVNWPRVALIAGVDEALEALAGRFILCVASNAGDSDAESMGQALARVDVRDYFGHLWTSRELGVNKPDLDFFRGVVQKLGLQPGECVMVGDSYERDIVPAKSVGMRTVWLNEARVVGLYPDADVVIHSMGRLVDALNELEEKGG